MVIIPLTYDPIFPCYVRARRRAPADECVLLEERGFGSLCVIWEHWGYR
eukprot:gene4607-26639_t